MSWAKYRLGDVCTMVTGKLNSNAAEKNGFYHFFTCSQETFQINEYAFDTEAVLLGGNNAAGIFPLKYYNGKFNAYQRTYIIESKDKDKLSTMFLYYSLRTVLSQFQNMSIGAATQYLTKSILDNFEIKFPTILEQRKIASILSAYDSLIENNRRRIQLLEQSARLLYREWFIYLRFPGHEHIRIIDGVPEGWRKKKLKEVADVNAISLNNGFQEKIEYIDISCVTTGQINETTLYEFKAAPGRARRLVRHGDIIWSCVRPNRESHVIIWNPRKNLIASTGFAVISPIEAPTSYIYQALTTKEFVGYLTNNARGLLILRLQERILNPLIY